MTMTGPDNVDNTSPSHRRRSRIALFPSDRRSDLFPVGSSVEVNTDEIGFENVFFSATVFPPPRKNSKKIHVQYTDLLADDNGSDRLRELVKVEFLRPVPPSEEIVGGFEAGDVVDAFYTDGWWVGVVARVVEGGSKFVVAFDEPTDELEFNLADLRPHWDWVQGKWRRPQSKSRSRVEVGRRVEVSFEGEDYQDAWFPATVQECLENGDFLVEYSNSKGEVVMANVDCLHVRPCPPLLRVEKDFFMLPGKVEAFVDFGWWSGVISKVLENSRYLVFRQMKLDKGFHQSELRAQMEWNDGEWLLSSVDGVHSNDNSSPRATREALSLLTKRRLCHSDQGAALKKHQVEGNAEGVLINYSKMPKGIRSKHVARNVKRTLLRVDQEEFAGLQVEETGQDTGGKIALEVEENSIAGKMMVVENVVGEVADNQEPVEVNPAPDQEEDQNISGTIADFVSSLCKEVEKEVSQVPNSEESFSKSIESETAFDSQCGMHNNSTVPSELHALPFEKTAALWQTLESTEVLQRFPQNPHFQPLAQQDIRLREGLAIGLMVNFFNLVKQTSRLQVSDPKSSMDEIMETLPVYESHGFDVSAIRKFVNELLTVKEREEKLLDESDNIKKQVLVQRREKDRIVEERKLLQEKLLLLDSAEAKVEEKIASLQAQVEETERKIKNSRVNLKVML